MSTQDTGEEIGHWNTQLAMSFGNTLLPIKSISWRVDTGKQVIHHLHKHNVGYVNAPQEIFLTITMYQMALSGDTKSVSNILLEAARRNQRFDVTLAVQDGTEGGTGPAFGVEGTGTWSFKSIVFKNCTIESYQGGNVQPGEAPEDVIQARCLSIDNSPRE